MFTGAFKTCSCGIEHTRSAWAALPFVGVQEEDPEGEDIELRNCECGSTIAVLVVDLREVAA